MTPDVQTISDIGCNNGYFSSGIARQGKIVYCFEPNKNLLQRAFFEAIDILSTRAGRGGMVVSPLAVDASTVERLPQVDATLLLSVLHYWVEVGGWSLAEQILNRIWTHTNRILFFELPNPVSNTKLRQVLSAMGETEEECGDFLVEFLGRLPGANVEMIDYLSTDFRPNERRHLLAVRRQ
jgi:SAM-dependent methyltransferase